MYVLNVRFFKSIDGGASWKAVPNNHGDNHDMWINPDNASNWIMGDDGGPQITFDGGKNFTEQHLPTAQFYHVNLDSSFPYNVYGPQQDNTSIKIKSRTAGTSITNKDWRPVGGGEAGYIVPDPTNPAITYGGEYDGIMSTFNEKDDQYRIISVYPEQNYGIGAGKIQVPLQLDLSHCLLTAQSQMFIRHLQPRAPQFGWRPDLGGHQPGPHPARS